jgi:hypothetical protein
VGVNDRVTNNTNGGVSVRFDQAQSAAIATTIAQIKADGFNFIRFRLSASYYNTLTSEETGKQCWARGRNRRDHRPCGQHRDPATTGVRCTKVPQQIATAAASKYCTQVRSCSTSTMPPTTLAELERPGWLPRHPILL